MYKPLKPKYYRIILYVLCMIFITSCECEDKKSPNPIQLQDAQTKQKNATIPFNKPWTEKLEEIPASADKQSFESSLQQLSITEREAIWELLNVIQDPTKQQSFLSVFMSFSQAEQERLFRILLYLRGRNQPLLCKLIDPQQELAIMEKVKMWQIIRELSEADQQLIEGFKEKLDNEMKN
jgi:hypothetical protein